MKRPNVILVSLDTLRADHISCYGYNKPTTPNIDRLAVEGTVFLNHYSTGVWTPPGHASMLTGLYVSEHGVYDTRKLQQNIPTIAEVLKKNGYQTAGFINNSQVGELVGLHKGHDTFEEVWKGIEPGLTFERIVSGIGRRVREKLGRTDKGAARTLKLFEKWIGNIDRVRPFYAFLHFIEPHNPLNPPYPYKDRYLKKKKLSEKIKKVAYNPLICFVQDIGLDEDEVEIIKALYDGEIAYVDSKIGELLATLKENKLYDDTMIIITSDHGEHFGEHGLWSHVASLYNEVLHVPLIVKYPRGVKYVEEVNGLTQHVDIFPTVMDVAGLTEGANKTSGISLVNNNSGKLHDYVFAEWEGRIPFFILDKSKEFERDLDFARFEMRMTMILDKYFKYISKTNGRDELYDLMNDRNEEHNLIGKNDDIKRNLKDKMTQKFAAMTINDAEKSVYDMNEEVKRNLTDLGYM